MKVAGPVALDEHEPLSVRFPVLSGAASSAFGELRNQLMVVVLGLQAIELAMHEQARLVAITRQMVDGRLPSSHLQHAAGVVSGAEESLRNVAALLPDLEHAQTMLSRTVESLASMLAIRSSITNLCSAARDADLLAHHDTKLAGGVVWDEIPVEAIVRAPHSVVVASLATALRIAAVLPRGRLSCHFKAHGRFLDVTVVGARPEVAAEIRHHLSDVRDLVITAELEGIRIRWTSATA